MAKKVDFDSFIMMTDKEFEYLISRLIRYLGFSISDTIDFGSDEKIYTGLGKKAPYLGKYIVRHKKGSIDDIIDIDFLKSTSHWMTKEGTGRVLFITNATYSDELKNYVAESEVSLIGCEELVALVNQMYDEETSRDQEMNKKRRKRPKIPYGKALVLKIESEYSIDLVPVSVKEWLNIWQRTKSELEVTLASVVKLDPDDLSKSDVERLKGLVNKLEVLYFDLMKCKVDEITTNSKDNADRFLENVMMLVSGILYEEPLEDLAMYRENIAKLDGEIAAINRELIEHLDAREVEAKKRERFRNMILLFYVSGILLLMSILVMRA
ncbi:restriction endonuclease [Chrysiogenes arsenatis]|uniref:restriction endonuclease n=1 Tax=Chrysiogenes arsenatis TaxID=309797 RepID=UPI000410C2A6|nr:restriction endonuclease [Chrysiogenes arsenatis]